MRRKNKERMRPKNKEQMRRKNKERMRPKKREFHELPYTEMVNPGLIDPPQNRKIIWKNDFSQKQRSDMDPDYGTAQMLIRHYQIVIFQRNFFSSLGPNPRH